MEEFPSNSQNPRAAKPEKPPEKEVTKIIKGNVVRRKKPLGQRFREMFFADSEQSIFDYIVGDVLVPAFKDMVTDAATQAMELRFFGDTRPNRRRPTQSSSGGFGSRSNYTNYNSYSSPQRRDDRPHRSRSSHDFDDIVLSSRDEAMDVLGTMNDYIGKYDQVSVGDLYELVGETAHAMDYKWGWTTLEGAGVRRVGNQSYLLVLPKNEALEI